MKERHEDFSPKDFFIYDVLIYFCFARPIIRDFYVLWRQYGSYPGVCSKQQDFYHSFGCGKSLFFMLSAEEKGGISGILLRVYADRHSLHPGGSADRISVPVVRLGLI